MAYIWSGDGKSHQGGEAHSSDIERRIRKIEKQNNRYYEALKKNNGDEHKLRRQEYSWFYLKFGYKIAPGLEIRLSYDRNDTTVYFDPDARIGENGWKRWEKLPGTVTMNVPNPPSNPLLLARALADYEATGKTYPFTS